MESRSESYPSQTASKGAGSRTAVNGTFYRVRRGDTLYAIAWRANRDFRELARWNGIRPPYVIYEGQTLRLRPVTSAKTGSRVASRTPVKNESGKAKSVRSPETKPSKKPVRKSPQPSADSRLRWSWPSAGRVISRFKAGDPLQKGIKLASAEGSDIRAAEAGKVVYSGSGLIGYGQLIIIKHNEKYLSAYGHNRKLLVKQNQRVTKGQKIAEMGRANDGRALLHFEIRRHGKPVDPLTYLPRR